MSDDWDQDGWDSEHPQDEDPEDFEGTGMREDEVAVELARRGEQPDNPALDRAREIARERGLL